MLKQGRRRIAFVGTVDPGYPEFLDRWKGYCRALRAAGIEPDERLQIDGDATESAGAVAVQRIIARDADFDAVFAASDVTAIGVMHAVQELGRKVPADVAIVGFDDIPAASLSSPRLTTVSQNPRQASEALIDAILTLIEGGTAKSCLLPAKLIVRESTVTG